jgi:hypothetical protein
MNASEKNREFENWLSTKRVNRINLPGRRALCSLMANLNPEKSSFLNLSEKKSETVNSALYL